MLSDPQTMAERWQGASEEELAAVLRWYVDMGVDLAVSDHRRNHFEEAQAKAELAASAPAPAPPEAGQQAPAPARTAPRIAPRLAPEPLPVRAASPNAAIAPEEAVAQARALAEGAQTIEALKAALADFDGCVLKRSASHLVFAEGPAEARLMIIGDEPGEADDREGRLFAGAPGVMLDAMLKSIGLTRDKCHLANLVPWRPPGKRPPYPHEVSACLPFLQRYLALAAPQIVITLGDLPVQTLLGARDPILRARGKWFEMATPHSQSVPAIAMLHPDYLLKAPATKRYAWADLRALKKKLADMGLDA